MAVFFAPPQHLKTELPLEFYALPNRFPCNFSTRFGKVCKRAVEFPLIPTVVHSHLTRDIFNKASELQRTFPEEIWDVKAPQTWDDLHYWFDPYDIHIMGASFLIQVMYKISEQNQIANAEMGAILSEAAAEWVSRNELFVTSLAPHLDIIPYVAFEELVDMKPREVDMYNLELDKHRHMLHSRLANERAQLQGGSIPYLTIPGASSPHPLYMHLPLMAQNMIGGSPNCPLAPPTRTAERLLNGLRLSAGAQSSDTQRRDSHQRMRGYTNDPARHVKLQPRSYSNDPTRQGKPQPRRHSNETRNKGQRTRGYSVISTRNEIERGPASLLRYASNPSTSFTGYHSVREPVYMLTPQTAAAHQNPPTQKSFSDPSITAKSPPRQRPFFDPSIIAQSPPRQLPLSDPSIIAQSPPRQQPLSDPSIIIQGPERTPLQSPNQRQQLQLASAPVYPLSRQESGLPAFRSSTSISPNQVSSSLQDERVLLPTAEPNPRQHCISESVAHNRQANREEYSIRRMSSSNSSASKHTVCHEVYEHPDHRGFARGAPKYSAQQVGEIDQFSTGKTVTFNGRNRQENKDPYGTQTLFIRSLSEEYFDSHSFRALLDDCGQVCDMTYSKPKGFNGSGNAFIHFTSVKSVEIGIKRFHELRLLDGRILYANHVTPQDRKFSYQKPQRNNDRISCMNANSIDSQISSRRPSIHTQPQAYTPHQYSSQQSRGHSPVRREPLTDGFERQLLSVTTQVEQGYHTVPTAAPLEDIPNMQKKKDATTKTKSLVPPNKENMPLKQVSETLLSSRGKETNLANQSTDKNPKQEHRKKKKSRQSTANNSIQPTPSTSPVKSRSTLDLSNMATYNSTKEPVQLRISNEKINDGETHRKAHSGLNKRTQKASKIKSQDQQEIMNPSPISNGNAVKAACTDSLSITAPDSRQASFASISSIALSDVSTTKAESSNQKPVETVESINSIKRFTKPAKEATKDIDNVSSMLIPPGKQNTNRQTVEPSGPLAKTSKSKKPNSHTKKESSESVASSESLGNSNPKATTMRNLTSEKQITESFTGKMVSKNLNNPREQTKKLVAAIPLPGVASETCDGNPLTTESTLSLNYDEQFPSLEPARPPSSAIVDRKRPVASKSTRGTPPSMEKLDQNQRAHASQSWINQNQSTPPVAISRTDMPGKKPSEVSDSLLVDNGIDKSEEAKLQVSWASVVSYPLDNVRSLGSISWPFVKNFREA